MQCMEFGVYIRGKKAIKDFWDNWEYMIVDNYYNYFME